MLLLLILVSIVGSTFPSLHPRIFNGTLATKGQFPWQAVLQIPKNNGMTVCGGALISELWVLTAAHCIFGAQFRIRVLLGTTKSTGNDPDQIELHSREWLIFNEFDPYAFEGDLGLVKLPESVTFTDYVKPIAVATTELGTNVSVTVSGWGAISDDNTRVADLMYSNLIGSSQNKTILTNPDPNSTAQNICGGDSGSALVAKYATNPVHVGVVSWYHNCKAGESAGFTATAYYKDWIFEQTGNQTTMYF